MSETRRDPSSAARFAGSEPEHGGHTGRERLPQLRAYWSAYAFGPDEVELKSIGRSVRLSGAGVGVLLPRLTPLVDGTRTVGEICELLAPHSPEAVARLIAALLGQGLLADGVSPDRCPVCEPASADPAICAFLEALVGLDRLRMAHDRVARSRVTVWGRDGLAARIAEMLRECRVAVQVRSWPGQDAQAATSAEGLHEDIPLAEEDASALTGAALAIGVGVCLRDRHLQRLNATCLATGTPWLPVSSDAVEATIGPLVLPGRSACLVCLRGRSEALAAGPATLLRSGSRPLLAPMIGAASGVAAYEVFRFLLGVDGESLVDQVIRIRHRALDWSRSDVMRLPGCPACASLQAPGGGG